MYSVGTQCKWFLECCKQGKQALYEIACRDERYEESYDLLYAETVTLSSCISSMKGE